MLTDDKNKISAEERIELHSQHGDYGADETILALGRAIADYLSLIAPKKTVDEAMAILVSPLVDISGAKITKPEDWVEVLEGACGAGYTEWPIGNLLFWVSAYAAFGVVDYRVLSGSSPRTFLEDAIKNVVSFYEKSPISIWGIPHNNDLHRLVLLASNRWALDNGDPIDPAALAIFGGVSEGRMRNMTSGQSRQFEMVGGKVKAQDALAWLSGREDFWPSIWERTEQPGYGLKREQPVNQAVFLPVARDGSVFHPGEARAGRYTVGPKGVELQIDTFDDALKSLQEMPTPYWRRPNEKGNWGIVSGIRWARFDRLELDAIAQAPGYRLAPDAQG
jgi:hypothetical protein